MTNTSPEAVTIDLDKLEMSIKMMGKPPKDSTFQYVTDAARAYLRLMRKNGIAKVWIDDAHLFEDCPQCDGDKIVEDAEGRGFPCGECAQRAAPRPTDAEGWEYGDIKNVSVGSDRDRHGLTIDDYLERGWTIPGYQKNDRIDIVYMGSKTPTAPTDAETDEVLQVFDNCIRSGTKTEYSDTVDIRCFPLQLVGPIRSALTMPPAVSDDARKAALEAMVYCVYRSDDESTHIFSTQEKANEYADSVEEPCVLSDYMIDHPQRYYERTN